MAVALTLRRIPRNLKNSLTLHVSFASFGTQGVSGRLGHPPTCRICEHVPSSVTKPKETGQEHPHIAPQNNADDFLLSGIFSRLSLSPAELDLTKEYVLPTVLHSPGVAILDPLAQQVQQIRDCPTNIRREIIERPIGQNERRIEVPTGRPITEKHARKILKIRRKKMKKHQYRKWKKRNKFKLRAMLTKRRKKKQKLWEEHLAKYRFKGLTSEYTEWYLAKKKEENAIFLKHLRVPLEEETPESLEEKEERQKSREKKVRIMYDPRGSWQVRPQPILPEGSSLKKLFDKQEKDAVKRIAELNKQS